MIKKVISIIVSLVVISSTLFVFPLSVGAASYKENIINEIINQDLITDYYHNYYFADLNLDGKKEFVVATDAELSQCAVYYMKGSKLLRADGMFAGPRNKLYYDTAKQKYIWNASEIRLFRSGIYSYEVGSINNTFNIKTGKITKNMYTSWQSVLVDERTAERKTTYYKGDFTGKNKKISKSKYNSINKNVKKNFVDAKAKIKIIEIYSLSRYSTSKLKSLLSSSYNAFSYKKMPKLNYKTVTIKKGKTLQLAIKNKKGKATFKSSNRKVATVNSKGKIKAKSKGKATITVNINGIKIKCTVTVK